MKPSRDWVSWLAFVALSLWASIYWIRTVMAVRHNYVAMPIWDYWETVTHLDRYRQFDFTLLWFQHNEHRIVFPEMAFATDYLLFQGREIFPLVLNVLIHLCTSALMAWTLYKTPRAPRNTAIAAGLLSAVLLGWPGVSLVLSSPFLLCWTMLEVFMALAFWEMARVPDSRQRWAHLCGAIACAAGANYSLANGLVLWPILILAAFWLRLKRREIAVLALSGAFFTWLFFLGYQASAATNPGLIFRHFGYWLRFIGCYLGMPFSLRGDGFGISMGWLSVAVLGAAAWRLRRDDVRGQAAGVLYMGFGLLTISTALLTSLARMDPGDVNFTAAKVGRYLLVPVLYWSSLLMVSVWLIGLERRGQLKAVLVMCGFGAILAYSLPAEEPWTRRLSDDFSRFQLASLSLEAGVEDKPLVESAIYPVLVLPHQLLPMMRDERVSVFADSRFTWMGRSFDESARKDSGVIPGGIFVARLLTGGLEILGWADADSGAKEFLFVDEAGRVVGIGERLAAGLPLEARFPVPDRSNGWVGFVNGQWHSKTVRAWAFSADRSRFRPVGQPIPVDMPELARSPDRNDPVCGTMLGEIDVPAPGAKIPPDGLTRGWAIARRPITRVNVYVDGDLKQFAGFSGPRPDVDKVYPAYREVNKGWQANLDLSRLAPGTHRMEVRAYEDDGCELTFGTRTFER